jgi:hypothetical protein
MIKNIAMMAIALLFVAATAPAASPPVEGPAVTEVLVFDVGANFQKFMELSKRADAVSKKYGSTGKARMWAAAYAGRDSGAVIVTVEHPSLVALARSAAKVEPSPEWRQLVADAQASSIKLMSDSIVVELKAP